MVTVEPIKSEKSNLYAMALKDGLSTVLGSIEAIGEANGHTARIHKFNLSEGSPRVLYSDLLIRAELNYLERNGYTKIEIPCTLFGPDIARYLDFDETIEKDCSLYIVRVPEFFEKPCRSEKNATERR